jgi:hypothetical protein
MRLFSTAAALFEGESHRTIEKWPCIAEAWAEEVEALFGEI